MVAVIQNDVHRRLSATELRERGCICEFGCRSCGQNESQLGNCPAFHDWSCPMGREPDINCPLNGVQY